MRIDRGCSGKTHLLLDFLQKNPQLKSGKFTSSFTYKTAQKMWNDVSVILNAVGPAQKNWNQWRKVRINKLLRQSFVKTNFTIDMARFKNEG